jgi:hypothetical protein
MTRILIGVPTSEYARRADFYDHFDVIEKPAETMVSRAHGQSPARNRNLIIKQALEYDCTHIFFVDDDVILPRDILVKLLTHDKDIVTGLYLMRNFPHQPIVFDEARPDGKCKHYFMPDESEPGLVPIVNCGLGAVLIKIEVFKKMPHPWITLGEAEADHWCDDITFFNRARALGFELFCDTSIHVGHIGSMVIKPFYLDGKWLVTYDTSGTATVTIPMPKGVYVEEGKI